MSEWVSGGWEWKKMERSEWKRMRNGKMEEPRTDGWEKTNVWEKKGGMDGWIRKGKEWMKK